MKKLNGAAKKNQVKSLKFFVVLLVDVDKDDDDDYFMINTSGVEPVKRKEGKDEQDKKMWVPMQMYKINAQN